MTINQKRQAKKASASFNNLETNNRYETWFLNLLLSTFVWKNLPDGMDARYLEKVLIEKGEILVFYDDIQGKFLNLPFTSNEYDLYGYPLKRNAYGLNGYRKTLAQENSIIIYNNPTRTSEIPTLVYYTERISQIKRAIDINVHNQKFPFLISCNESQKLTMENIYKNIDNFEPVIYTNKMDLGESLKILPVNAPFISLELYELYEKTLNEFLEYCCVNSSSDKKERLLTNEILVNSGSTNANRQMRLQERKKACDLINEKYGLNIEVDFRNDISSIENLIDEANNEENDEENYEENNEENRKEGEENE